MGVLKMNTDFKDGDDGSVSLGELNIREVSNGYLVDHIDEFGEATHVFNDRVQLLEFLTEVLGL